MRNKGLRYIKLLRSIIFMCCDIKRHRGLVAGLKAELGCLILWEYI